MKKILYALALTSLIAIGPTGPIGANEESLQQDPTSTCWLTCFSLTSGVTYYKTFNVTQEACCSGSALSCPSGSRPSLSWGEPAQACGPTRQ